MSLPPPPLPSNANARGIPTAGGGTIELAIQQQMGRDLLDILQPGSVLSGRVVERFANGSYLFSLRGRNLIADSSVPLNRDTVVQFQVLNSADGLRLRLLDGSGNDRAQTSNLAGRLQQLGLPNTPPANLVLSAFERAQAPLGDPARLQQALQQVEQAPPQRQPAVAAAHALLAKAGLPATPALVALAERANLGNLPDPAGAINRLVTGIRQEAPQLFQAMTGGQQTASATPTAQATTGSPTAPPAAAAAMTTPGTTGGTAPATVAPNGPMTQVAGQIEQLIGQIRSLGLQSAFTPGGPATEAAPPANEARRPNEAGLPAHQRGDGRPPPSPEAAPILRDLDHQQALRQEATTVARLALAHPDSSGDLRHLAATVARELGADLVFKPSQLDDYDMVLPLALQQGPQQRSPARMAVAHRQTSGGETMTFLRVDLELEGLGPLSLRLNAAQAGVIAITLFATGGGLTALQAGIDDLQNDLTARGLDAKVRLADLLEDGPRGR